MTKAHRTKELYEQSQRLHAELGQQAYSLDVFGDELAEREKYKGVTGIDAVHLYICLKFCWKPSDVRAMTEQDLRFLLTQEMHNWTLPKEARV
ncbi:MAG: hypothetical protein KKH71_18495 [Gammaproteobacteria bacterium]|nr:hypothetical protein [Gammaproteobacteria bacterium]MBU1476484.1 hypothetical protein [Gammaproteobacteria bacterium]MBU2003055.1 hypothetical protein [Gammaproteobacteria bacterium]MBU2130919.1 hypothetical protein [Gammaproteobacteria bacterium]